MKRFLPLLALLSAPAFAQDAAPAAAPAPSAPAASAARPVPGRLMLPSGPKWDALPPDEREHVRKMAEFRAARDEAERDLLKFADEAQARKQEILAENEEAKELFDRIVELQAELTAATNALETIYRADEKLQAIADKIVPARKIVEANQYSLNQEVVQAMRARMAKQREALEAEKPAPEPVPETPESLGMEPEAYSNLVVRPAPVVVPGTVNPDIKPPKTR